MENLTRSCQASLIHRAADLRYPDNSQSGHFSVSETAGLDNSQFIDLQGRTFLSYLYCRVGQFSVYIFQSIAVFVIKLYKLKND